ncbi:MAG: ribonuclease PH, partial [Aquificaceae bacterium]|nr:ribonuclease PH [Aquificaceae bacterium]
IKLYEGGVIGSTPIKDFVAAVSVGIIKGKILLDLNFEEDSSAEVDMNLVATGSGNISEIQALGEEHSFTREEFDRMLTLGLEGIKQLIELQRAFFEVSAGNFRRKNIKEARL